MIADLLGESMAGIPAIMDKVTAIRPITAGLGDVFPFLLWETSGLSEIHALNRKSTGWYEGVVRVHCCATDYAAVGQLCEAVKLNLPGETFEDDAYAITRIRFEDESDIEQAADAHEVPYFVKVVDLFVRGRRK